MRLGFFLGAAISFFVLASSVDGALWKYSQEREDLRARAELAEAEARELAEELRALRSENERLRDLGEALERDLEAAEASSRASGDVEITVGSDSALGTEASE